MRIFLWVIGVLLALWVLLCLTRVGVTMAFGEKFVLTLRVGLLRFHFDSSAPQKPAKTKHEKKPPKPKKEVTAADLKSKLPRITLSDVKEMYHTLWPVAKRALDRTRRGIRIRPLRLALYLGGEDPADLAQLYGFVNAAVWTVMPQLERLLVIPDPSIHIEVDFQSDGTRAEGEVGLSARIGTLLWIGAAAGIPVLRWLLHFQKTHRPPAKAAEPAPSAPADTTPAA